MCSPAPPKFSLSLISLDPGDWISVLVVALMCVAAACIVLYRFKPGIPRRVALALFACVGLLLVADGFISFVLRGGFEAAYNSWLLVAMHSPGQICSDDGLTKALRSHDVVSGQLVALTSSLFVAVLVMLGIYDVFVYLLLEKRAWRRVNM